MASPRDLLRYVVENTKESDFLNALSYHVGNYSIGEITDRQYQKTVNGFRLVSESYSLNLAIEDDDVLTALYNGLYVTTFISRKKDQYQVHFLCHKYPLSMKPKFEEEILEEVLQYMILKTIIALRLDTEYKIDQYLKKIYEA